MVTTPVVTARPEWSPIVLRLCHSVDGVVAVHDHLRCAVDDHQAVLEPPQTTDTRPFTPRF
jgi:hypothetical protein